MALHITATARKSALDTILDAINTGGPGKLVIYDGTVPSDAGASLDGTNHTLVAIPFGATAFTTPAAVTGSSYAKALTGGTAIGPATVTTAGTATFASITLNNGTTRVADMSIGVGTGDLQFSSLVFALGANVTISSFTATMPV